MPPKTKKKGRRGPGASAERNESVWFRVASPDHQRSIARRSALLPLLPRRRARPRPPAARITLGPSGLPLPRFVSLKSGRVNSRIGPGVNYSVDWMYLKPGLPMEIIQEFDTWRRVRDADGSEGWINQSLLSGRRTAIVAPWQRGKDAPDQPARRPGRKDASVVAIVEPGVMGTIKSCNGNGAR